jgi:hypothetical protein
MKEVQVATYAEKVKKAVADPHWQQFRKSLKGLSTYDKLQRLGYYYCDNLDLDKHAGIEPCGLECDVCVRVDNYIKALCRGGQLYPGETLWTIFQKQFHVGTAYQK